MRSTTIPRLPFLLLLLLIPPSLAATGDSGSDSGPTSDSIEDLSVSELKTQLELAVKREKEAKSELDTAEKALIEREKETIEPDRDFGEKKKAWETADREATKMEEGWNIDEKEANSAVYAYDLAKTQLNTAVRKLGEEREKLDGLPKQIADARALVASIKDRPNRLRTLKQARQDKIDGKPALEASLAPGGPLRTADENLSKAWNTAVKTAEDHQKLLSTCKEQGLTADCSALETAQTPFNNTANQAKRDFDAAHDALTKADKELVNFASDIREMDRKIRLLVQDCDQSKIDSDTKTASEAVNALEEALKNQPDEVSYWSDEKIKTVKDEIIKLIARDVAIEKVENGKPIEVDDARTSANHALFSLNSARNLKMKKDGEVTKAQDAVTRARSAHTEAESEVEALTKRYETAKRKESKKGPNAAMIGGLCGGFAVVLLLVVAGILLCWLKHWFCFKKIDNQAKRGKNPKESDVESGNLNRNSAKAKWWQFWTRCVPKKAVSKGSKGSKVTSGSKQSAAPQLTPYINILMEDRKKSGKLDSAGNIVATPVRTEATPASTTPVQQTPVKQPPGQKPPAAEEEDLSYLPPPPNKPYWTPGEEPFRIKAKWFQWRGPSVGTTRRHGEPIHDFDAPDCERVKMVDLIWFDPLGCTATEIGQSEIVRDDGPRSDSDKSEYLTNLSEWERNHKIYMAELAAGKKKLSEGRSVFTLTGKSKQEIEEEKKKTMRDTIAGCCNNK